MDNKAVFYNCQNYLINLNSKHIYIKHKRLYKRE